MEMRRREVMLWAALAMVGAPACSRAKEAAGPGGGAATQPAMLVHRDPGCGCCEAWADMAKSAGYAVELVDEADMSALKRRLGVPQELASCHTAEVQGAVIEGHVPFAVLARFLDERPAGALGLAVPGMPLGSPGMEVAGRPAERFVVHAFDSVGRSRAYWTSPGEGTAVGG